MTQKRILIVDDDPDFLLQMELILERGGYQVLKACCRKDGEAILNAEKPDGIIVDLMMEETDDGFTLCYNSKKLYPAVPIILVTGVANETGIEFEASTDEERSWIKADTLLAKPVRSEQVLGELEKLLKD